MNTAKELYDRWLAQPELDTAVAEELHGIAGDDAAITDRFYRDLEFGTGGLRGVLGAGTNRMNLYTVRKATQGLADYLNATDLPKKIAIAHDSRNNGELFTREAARVLAANGITAPTARPYGQPHTMPHSSTGMCIGSSILPICGICPVISGSTRPRAKNRAERVSLRVDVFMIQTPHILFFI